MTRDEWGLPRGRWVSLIEFDGREWVAVTVVEASLIEDWGGDVVYLSRHPMRQFYARPQDALAARTVSALI